MSRFLRIQKIERHGFPNAKIRVFRDDLYPFLGGGNKARKFREIEKEILRNNADAIVTTGGIQSNHCRVAAITAAQNRWPCYLVLHGDKERYYSEKGNALLMRKAGAVPAFVEPAEISDAMDEAMRELKDKKYSPFYVNGGGHMVSGAGAFTKAVKDLKEYLQNENWMPDAIFLPSGTGSTQAGILAGLEMFGLGSIPVHGISVGREKERGTAEIVSLLDEMSKKMDCTDALKKVNFYDEWLAGGYESSSPTLAPLIDSVFENTGLLLDETYSGKAWLGMSDMLKSNAVSGNILFWHTGGILNLMA